MPNHIYSLLTVYFYRYCPSIPHPFVSVFFLFLFSFLTLGIHLALEPVLIQIPFEKQRWMRGLKTLWWELGTTCRFSSSAASTPGDLWLMTLIYLICNQTLPLPLSRLRTLEHVLFSQVKG